MEDAYFLKSLFLGIMLFSLFLGGTADCDQQLGMESGDITDSQLSSAKAYKCYNHSKARLNLDIDECKGYAPEDADDSYVKVDLLVDKNVSGVIMQQSGWLDEYVTTMKVKYKASSSSSFSDASVEGDTDIETNLDKNTHTYTILFDTIVVARYVQIQPLTYKKWPTFRFDLLGCDIGVCLSGPCHNGASCMDASSGYTCQCLPGFDGVNCHNNIDECGSSPCENAGTCVDGINQYMCTCLSGYNGTSCQNNIDECGSSPCENAGTCVDGINQYTCTCLTGYSGFNCQHNINECASSPCHSGACVDGINAYACDCFSGYTGLLCENNIDECGSSPCENGGTCVDGINQYTCNCLPGYNGTNCEININECHSSPCQNEGICTDSINSFSCTCPETYSGSRCETYVFSTESSADAMSSESSTTSVDSGQIMTTMSITTIQPTEQESFSTPNTDAGAVEQSTSQHETNTQFISTAITSSYESAQLVDHSQQYATASISVSVEERKGTRSSSRDSTSDENGYERTITTYKTESNSVHSSRNTKSVEEANNPTFAYLHQSTITTISGQLSIEAVSTTPLATILSDHPVTQIIMSTDSQATAKMSGDNGFYHPDCPRVSSVVNAEVFIEDIIPYNAVVTIQCHIGFEFSDSTTIRSFICGNKQEWSPTDFHGCFERRCRYVDPVSSEKTVLQTSSILELCEEHQRMNTGLTFTESQCSSMGSLYTQDFSCKEKRCPPPPLIANGNAFYTDTDGSAVVECLKGFHFPKGNKQISMVCQGTSWMHETYPSCSAVVCDALNYTRASVNTSLALYGTFVKVECDRGYQHNTGDLSKVMVCNDSGQWNDSSSGVCIEIVCPFIPSILHGVISQRQPAKLDSTALVKCDQGYKQREGYEVIELVCLPGDVWSYNLHNLSCRADRCDPVPKMVNALPHPVHTDVGTIVVFTCFNGYAFEDGSQTKEITCDRDLTWHGVFETECMPLKCPSLLTYDNVKSIEVQDDNNVGMVSSYACIQGYVSESGNRRMVVECLPTQNWNKTVQCSPVKCPTPESIDHGYWMSSDVEFVFGSSLKYYCQRGYISSGGNETIRCASDGHWSDKPAVCKEVRCQPIPTWSGYTVNSSSVSYNTHINYSCSGEVGVFETGEEWRAAVCDQYAQWDPPIASCAEIKEVSFSSSITPTESKYSHYLAPIGISLFALEIGVVLVLDCLTIKQYILMLKRNLGFQ